MFPKCFLEEPLFLVFLTKCLPSSTNPLPPLPFCKMLHLKCLAVFWIRLCLNNCSVFCTVALCYELHQRNSVFWHIQHSLFFEIYTGIFNHVQCYQGIFTHIDTLLRHIQAHSGIFITLCNPHIFTALP